MMVAKEKLFLISSKADESIKSSSPVFDITLFKTYNDLESYVGTVPVVVNTIIITTDELPFTNVSINRLFSLLKSPFLSITGSVVYLIDRTYNYNTVNGMFNTSEHKVAVYQDDLSLEYISSIVSGEGRQSNEGQIGVVTYRVRASEYVKAKANKTLDDEEFIDADKYKTDEDELAGIPAEEEPVEIRVSSDIKGDISYFCGLPCQERTIMSFIAAQYLSLSGKTIIMERDTHFHRMTEFVTKSGVDCEHIQINDIFRDFDGVLKTIKDSSKWLIVITAIDRIDYDYSVIFDLLYNNLYSHVMHFVKECDLSETPYGVPYFITTPNNVPDLLKTCMTLKFDVDPKLTKFIGIQAVNLFPATLREDELASITARLLSKICVVKLFKIQGLLLQKGGSGYDLSGIFRHTN